MIRILHAADLHLDSPFESLPEEKAALRRSEQRALLRSLAQLRAETGAELVLLSGDIFDSDRTWPETEDALRLAPVSYTHLQCGCRAAAGPCRL